MLIGSEPIRIGAVFSTTGIAAPHNRPMLEMTELAIEELNSKGGLLGRPLQLMVIDNNSSPIGSSIAANQLVKENVCAVIGAHWSSHSLAMASILQKAKIPMISPGSTNPEVTKERNYVFRACFIDSFQGRAMARFAYDELKARKAVVVTNIDEDYSTTLANYFSSSFMSMGGRIQKNMSYRGSATDFSSAIESIESMKPDVIYIPGYTRDSGLFIKQSRKMNLKTIFLGGDAWDEIENVAQDHINGNFQSAPWHPEVPFPESKKLQQLYQEKFGKPIQNMSSPLAYDAVMILAQAITKAGSAEPVKIRETLAETDHLGATGHIQFDHNGDPIDKATIIIEFQNSKRVFGKVVSP
ncbi:branched-chain amino acid ABC transporter substrate-binding protein [Desulforhopalus sp. 52FAK]